MDTNIFVSNENLKDFWLGIQPVIKEMVPDVDLVYIGNLADFLKDKVDEKAYLLWIDISSEDKPLLKYKAAAGSWVEVAGSGIGGGSYGEPVLTPLCNTSLATSLDTNDPVYINFKWEWDNGVELTTQMRGYVEILINQVQRYHKRQNAGDFADNQNFNLRPFLVSGSNEITVNVTDMQGNKNTVPLVFTVDVIQLKLETSYEPSNFIRHSQNPVSYPFSAKVTGAAGKLKNILATLTNNKTGETEKIYANNSISSDSAEFTIPLETHSHGVYTLKVFATTTITSSDGTDVTIEAKPLLRDIAWLDDREGATNTDPLIYSSFDLSEADQYEIIRIPYYIYDPNMQRPKVSFAINGNSTGASIDVTRGTFPVWTVSSPVVGINVFSIICGNSKKDFSIQLREVPSVDIDWEQNSLILHLQADEKHTNDITSGEFARDNWGNSAEALNGKESEKSVIKSLKAQFTNFTWAADGWKSDSTTGIPYLRITDGASLTIPYTFFSETYTYDIADGVTQELKKNPRYYGATLELDIKISNVFDYNKAFFSCMFNNIGIQITPQAATLKTKSKEIVVRFTSDSSNDLLRISFVINPYTEQVLQDGTKAGGGTVLVYLNGIASGCIPYTKNDSFLHIPPKNYKSDQELADQIDKDMAITITSADSDNNKICTVDLFNVRIYNKNLSSSKILNNWMQDMRDISNKVAAYTRNDIFKGSTDEPDYNKLVKNIPCMTIIGKELPSAKGDRKEGIYIDFRYSPPGAEDNEYNFTLANAQIDIQGTSSQYYPLKNWKFKSKYKNKDKKPVTSKFNDKAEKYAISKEVLPSTVFCLKIDFMESSGTHNTTTANIVNTMYDFGTPPQRDGSTDSSKIRTTIYGRPIVVFHKKTAEDLDPTFIGKFNFNYDKDAKEIFGFTESADYEVIECIEFKNNTSNRCLLHQSEYKNPTPAPASELDEDYVDKQTGMMPAWREDFEVRYQYRRDEQVDPSTKLYEEPHKYLKAVTDWLVTVDASVCREPDYKAPNLNETYVTNTAAISYVYRVGKGTSTGVSYTDQNGIEHQLTASPLSYTDTDVVKFIDHNGFIRKAVEIGLLDNPLEEYEFDLDVFYDYKETVVTGEGANKETIETVNTYYAVKIDDDGNEIFAFTQDTASYRLAKFKTELEEHFNKHYLLMYYVMTDLLAMIDSRTKNMFWATWGERYISDDPNRDHSDPTKDNVVIWYPIFYDMDTMMGISNAGIMDIPYYVEYDTKHTPFSADLMSNIKKGYYNAHEGTFHESYADNKWGNELVRDPENLYFDLAQELYYTYENVNGPYDETVDFQFVQYQSTVGNLFNGATNVLWNNVEDAFSTELRELFAKKTSGTEAPLHLDNIFNAYKTHGETWCEAIYNIDGKTKFIDPYLNGYSGLSETSTQKPVLSFPNYLYALQGNRLLHRRYWLTNRYDFLFSKYSASDFMNNYISMRLYTPEETDLVVPPSADFTITTDMSQHVSIKFGSKTSRALCEQYRPEFIEAPPDRFIDTETMIFGASHIIDIGDLSGKYARSIDISKAKRLRKLAAGHTSSNYSNTGLKSVTTRGCNMLQEVYLRNCHGIDDLDLSSNYLIEKVDVIGTALKEISLPEGGVLKELRLPDTFTTLSLKNHPKLTSFELVPARTIQNDSYYRLTTINIENTPINSADLVANSPNLQGIRILGITDNPEAPNAWRFGTADTLLNIKNNIFGLDPSGQPSRDWRPMLHGTCYVHQIPEHIYNELMMFFNEANSMETIEQKRADDKLDFDIIYGSRPATNKVLFYNRYTQYANGKVNVVDKEYVDVGLYNDRVETGNSVIEQLGTISLAKLKSMFTRPSDWNYLWTCTGFYYEDSVDGSHVSVSNFAGFTITQDMIFYPIYSKTPKKYDFELWRQPSGKNYYEDSPFITTTELTYGTVDATYTIPVLKRPGSFNENNPDIDYVTRFSGWSRKMNAERGEEEIGTESTFSLTEDLVAADMLEAPKITITYYTVYYIDRKYPITFFDDNKNVLSTKDYFWNDKVISPTSGRTKSPTTDFVYTFAGWQPVDANGNKLAGEGIITLAEMANKRIGDPSYYLCPPDSTSRPYYFKASFNETPRMVYATYIVNGKEYKEEGPYRKGLPAYTGGAKSPVVSNISSSVVINGVSKKRRTVSWTENWTTLSDKDDSSTGYHRKVVLQKNWSVVEYPTLQYKRFKNDSGGSDSLYRAVDSGEFDIRNIYNRSGVGRFRSASGNTDVRGKTAVTFDVSFAPVDTTVSTSAYSDFAQAVHVDSAQLPTASGYYNITSSLDLPYYDLFALQQMNYAAAQLQGRVYSLNDSSGTIAYKTIIDSNNQPNKKTSSWSVSNKFVDITNLNSSAMADIKPDFGHCCLVLYGCNIDVDEFTFRVDFTYVY